MGGWGIILWLENSHLRCKLIWMITNFDKLKLKLSQAISNNFAVKLRRTENFPSQCTLYRHRVIRWNIILMSNIYCATDDVLIDSSLRNIFPFEWLHCKCNTQQTAFIVIQRSDYYSLSMKQWNHKNWRRQKGEIISTHHRGILHTHTALLNIFTENLTTKTNRRQLSAVSQNFANRIWYRNGNSQPSDRYSYALHFIWCVVTCNSSPFFSLSIYWSCRKK